MHDRSADHGVFVINDRRACYDMPMFIHLPPEIDRARMANARAKPASASSIIDNMPTALHETQPHKGARFFIPWKLLVFWHAP
jgi:hypothetical protein